MAPALRVVPGQTLEGRFLILERIGKGGMATIFKARDLEHESRVVAVKVPLPQYTNVLSAWAMFQHEAQIGGELDHPYVLKFISLEPNKDRNYVVTEYVEGSSLASRVGKGKTLPESEALRIMSRLCEAVDYLHRQGVVHYDLKPGNVMLCADGSIRLIDFGLAHALVKGRFALSAPAPAIGTSDYVAPEQIRRKRGRRSVDIYALGSILYEMLTGHPPFEGDDPFVVSSARQIGDPKAPRALNPAISPQVEEIVLRSLRRDPADRYATVSALKKDVDHPDQVEVSGLANRLVVATRWRKSLRMMRYVALVGVAPVAFMVGLFLLLWRYL